jgi:hypothetical protein
MNMKHSVVTKLRYNRVINIIRIYIDHMKFCCLYGFFVYHILLYYFGYIFLSFYVWLCVLCVSVQLFKLCIFIITFMYSYCYVCNILFILFYCIVVSTVCV